MARSRFDDLLQNHRFWAVDVDPSANPPFFVLGGLVAGFKSIQMPAMQIETVDIKQLGRPGQVAVVKAATYGDVSFSRGVRGGDASLHDWAQNAVDGFGVVARNLLVVQYSPAALRLTSATAAAVLLPDAAARLAAGGQFGKGWVPSRLWFLRDAVPVQYDPGANMDADDDGISIQKLDVRPTWISELSIGSDIAGDLAQLTAVLAKLVVQQAF